MAYEKYLGDGVYASFDGFSINIAVNDNRNHAVALDVDVMEALIQYKKETDELANAAMNQAFGVGSGISARIIAVDDMIPELGSEALKTIDRDIRIHDVIEVLDEISVDIKCHGNNWLMDKIAISKTLLKSILINE